MEPVTKVSAIIAICAVALKIFLPMLVGKELREKAKKKVIIEKAYLDSDDSVSMAHMMLIGFAIFVMLYGVMSLVMYWQQIKQNQDNLVFAFWLFLTMIAGMFVQVLASNYRFGRPLFEVTVPQLVFPILFSVVVFYPIWAVSVSSSKGFFQFTLHS